MSDIFINQGYFYNNSNPPGQQVDWWENCVFLSHMDGDVGTDPIVDISEGGVTKVIEFPYYPPIFAPGKFNECRGMRTNTTPSLSQIAQSDQAYDDFLLNDSGGFMIDFWCLIGNTTTNGGYPLQYSGDTIGTVWEIITGHNNVSSINDYVTISFNMPNWGGLSISLLANEDISPYGDWVANDWNHIAIICNQSLAFLYLNGIAKDIRLTGSFTSQTFSDPTCKLKMYGSVPAYFSSSMGIDEVRILKGGTDLPSAQTPPSVPYSKYV